MSHAEPFNSDFYQSHYFIGDQEQTSYNSGSGQDLYHSHTTWPGGPQTDAYFQPESTALPPEYTEQMFQPSAPLYSGNPDHLEDEPPLLEGDGGYPLKLWLLTAGRNPRNSHEEEYNRVHTHNRVVIEQTFGLLKARFRCLSRSGGALLYRPEKMAKITMTCVMLHNMCVWRNVPLPPDIDMHAPGVDDEDEDRGVISPLPVGDAQDGRAVRQSLIDEYF
ncbi:protein YIPF7 isoform X2 [Ambystoma mexicanum]|uniref:protein YIPF7 isoform X2 n=1 Tax=Ambystoma mexicanum TaxID=8296 RepID=UPI0037E8C39A